LPQTFKILVIGAGPAGIAAAVRAAECGVGVGLVDDNPSLGGQIWRNALSDDQPTKEAAAWYARLRKANVTDIFGARVFHSPEPGVLLAEEFQDLIELKYQKLVLATGARERFLPFPGWTLPNVMGAGGLQALVKSGLPIRGKRVLIAGTGPLLLAVAAYLRKHGAEIPIICEQASWGSLTRFAVSLVGSPTKIAQAIQLKNELAGVPLAANAWPVAAHGGKTLESVTVARRGRREQFGCDYLACGFHLVPNIELAALLGCQMQSGFVQIDDFQRTSIPNVFCVGEPTGIGGLELSLVEGQIAGLAAADRKPEAESLFSERSRCSRFARILDRTFRLRPELKMLASADTIVCRCEDVRHSRLAGRSSWRAAKLHTRCGMGPCQGRICGPASEFLFGWNPDSIRPPIFPARVEHLAGLGFASEPQRTGAS
jgi:D-hydroxyproline dehydrogenase subunit alpha